MTTTLKPDSCLAVVEQFITDNKFNFDDIERIYRDNGGVTKSHKWGSDTDRRYRSRLLASVKITLGNEGITL